MTTKDKEIFCEKLKGIRVWNVDFEIYDDRATGPFKSIPTYAVSDIERIVNEMTDEYSVWRSCGEEDYLKACELASKMETEAKQWKETAMHHQEELERLRIIIKTIEFVCGRKLEI